MTVVDAVDARPLRPRVVARAVRRRGREQLEVDDGLGTVSDGGLQGRGSVRGRKTMTARDALRDSRYPCHHHQ